MFQKAFAQGQTFELQGLQSIAQQLGAQSSGGGLGDLINQIFYVVLAVAIVLAVSMVIRGGYEYMTSSDSGDKKSRAKRRIQAAFGGLLLAVGSVVILNSINRGITNFSISFPQLQGVDLPQEYVVGPDGKISFVGGDYIYADSPGHIIGGGESHLDTDGSPGTYKVVEDPNGSITIDGKTYRSVGATHLDNAGKPGNWWGVATDSRGQPIINSDGTLNPVLSWRSNGQNRVNGDTSPFVALSKAQLRAAKSYDPNFGLGSTVFLTSNGKTVEAVYADYAGGRPSNYSEFSPAAADALGLDYRVEPGSSNYVRGNVTISLPEN
jgi:hypothetical protein